MSFSQPGYAEKVWKQLQIECCWGHHDRPAGERFLGSIRIHQDRIEQLLTIVSQNLPRVRPFTLAELEERFSHHDRQRHWIKLVTLALSEYAYYDEGSDGFWCGICDRLKLENTQGVYNTLREVLDQGFKRLGLVVVKDKQGKGTRYVSTLCLQSGIPQQNLKHFAQLLQEMAQDYGWWDITHAEPEDLSQIMYEDCNRRHQQWGKLRKFLEMSYTKGEEVVEPISGQLLQGIAIVAQELERRNQSPEILRNDHQREDLLQNYYLPNNFFLRSWDNLIGVLTHQERTHTTRQYLIGLRKKPLVLMLDVADSLEIQLHLPTQLLWQSEWEKLRGTYCQIQEQGWETRLPEAGALEISALSQPIDQINQQWIWRLKSHNDAVLTEWHCEGISDDLPILIFDAWTGDRLVPPNALKGKTEIICFFGKGTQLELSNEIELLDGFVPCSIAGWRGQHLHLRTEQTNLTFHSGDKTQVIAWNCTQTEYPQLRGLKLKSPKPIYLEVPVIWHPPLRVGKSLNILVEDLSSRTALTPPDATIALLTNSNWQEISLSQWITRSGSYAVRLWNQGDRWSEQFEVKSSFELSQPSKLLQVEVSNRTQTTIEIPLQCSSLSEFWSEDVTLQGLWTLEEVRFSLTNGQETQEYLRQANPSGGLSMSLAAMRDVLPESSWYAFSYQGQGEESQRLIEMSSREPVSYTWASQAIHISGLELARSYTLIFWNLLTPQVQPLKHSISLSEQDTLTVPLKDFFGIFYVWLESSMQPVQCLGWWCGIQEITNLSLPDKLSDDLFEYCMNIFENQPIKTFLTEVEKLNWDLDSDLVRRAIVALETQSCDLPNWLDRFLFKQKLEALLPQTPVIQKLPQSAPIAPPTPRQVIYQIKLQNDTSGMRREFHKRFVMELKQTRLESVIQPLRDKVLKDLVRVELSDREQFPRLKTVIQNIESKLHTPITLTEWKR